MILCPDDAAASALAGDFTALTGEDCEILPGRDYVFYSADAVSRSGEQRRLTALEALSGRAPAVVITAEGLFQRAMPPEVFRRAVFTLDVKEPCAPEDVVDALLRCGYSSSAQVEGPGQFSRRGGIVDFFSPAYPQPVRVEFWGDEIDSMGFFDTVSQRRTESAGRCRIVPAAEVLPTLAKGGAQAVAGLPRGPRGQCVEAPRRRDGGPCSPAYCARTPSASRAARSCPPPTATPRSYTAAQTPPSTTSRATPSSVLDQPGALRRERRGTT